MKPLIVVFIMTFAVGCAKKTSSEGMRQVLDVMKVHMDPNEGMGAELMSTGDCVAHETSWCTISGRKAPVGGPGRFTQQKCIDECARDNTCVAAEWWEGSTSCFLCTTTAYLQLYLDEDDGGYPPWVFEKCRKCVEHETSWCTQSGRKDPVGGSGGFTTQQCIDECARDNTCVAAEWWEGSTSCFLCTTTAYLQLYLNEDDGGYPPWVFEGCGNCVEYEASWCTIWGRKNPVGGIGGIDGFTKQQCIDECTRDNTCVAAEWWEGITACFLCTTTAYVQLYLNEDDVGYPPWVIEKCGDDLMAREIDAPEKTIHITTKASIFAAGVVALSGAIVGLFIFKKKRRRDFHRIQTIQVATENLQVATDDPVSHDEVADDRA